MRAAVLDHWASGAEMALVVACTGSGKTAGAHYALEDILSSGKRLLWVAAQEELVRQPEATLRRWFPKVTSGIVQAGVDQPAMQATYASLATLNRSPERLEAILAFGVPDVVVLDEAHETAGRSYRKLIARLREAGVKRFLGLTATPKRGDGQSLSDVGWRVVYDYPIIEAIGDGAVVQPYISDCKLPGLDLGKVAVAGGDYLTAELERALVDAHVVEHTVAALGRLHEAVSLPFRTDRKTFDPRAGGILVHTTTIKQAEDTAKALCEAGWVARTIHSKTPKADRRRLLAQFGKTVQVLCSPAALAQGTDLPLAHTNVLARATKSWRLYVQIFGRVLRPVDGKGGGLTIDLVGAAEEHSLIGAPVLVDGSGCPGTPDEEGPHVYHADASGISGWCEGCGHTVPCLHRKGAHLFKKGKCVSCGTDQCKEHPEVGHIWRPVDDGKKVCACGAEVYDRMFALVHGRRRIERAPVDWRRLRLPREVWGVDLGRTGKLYNVRVGETEWRPFWLNRKGKLHPLANGPVPAELARMLTDDIARQSEQIEGRYGKKKGVGATNMALVLVEDEARKLRIWDV